MMGVLTALAAQPEVDFGNDTEFCGDEPHEVSSAAIANATDDPSTSRLINGNLRNTEAAFDVPADRGPPNALCDTSAEHGPAFHATSACVTELRLTTGRHRTLAAPWRPERARRLLTIPVLYVAVR